MPIFEYQCTECGKVTEKIKPRPLAEIPCPFCAGPALRRVSRTALSTSGNACGDRQSGFT